MNEEHLEYHRSKLAGRIVLHVLIGAVSGGLFGLAAHETLHCGAQLILPESMLPDNRFGYSIVLAQLCAVLGLLKAMRTTREQEQMQRTANELELTYVDEPRGEPLACVSRLFAPTEISHIDDAFSVSHPKFGLMVAKVYYDDDGRRAFGGIVALVMALPVDFPRCVALPRNERGIPYRGIFDLPQIKNLFGKQEVDFGAESKFASKFRVIGPKADRVRLFLGCNDGDGTVGDFLLRRATWQLRAGRGCVALWDNTATMNDQASVRRWVSDVRELADRLGDDERQTHITGGNQLG